MMKIIWGLYPNHMHIFRPWQKHQCRRSCTHKLSPVHSLCYIRGVIRKFAEKCYKIALLLSIAMKIHRYKLHFIANWLKLKFWKCDVRRMSTRRRCDVTLLETAHPWVSMGCFSGLKLVVVFELIGILMESNVPSFFEDNMRFLCYSAALCIQINGFQCQRTGLKCVNFSRFSKL